MTQQNLAFDPPASRRTDPLTSHLAEIEHTQSGMRACQRDYIYKLVCLHPGSTAHELALYASRACLPIDLDSVQITRRLNDLADTTHDHRQRERPIYRGDARKCRIVGRKCLTWWPK